MNDVLIEINGLAELEIPKNKKRADDQMDARAECDGPRSGLAPFGRLPCCWRGWGGECSEFHGYLNNASRGWFIHLIRVCDHPNVFGPSFLGRGHDLDDESVGQGVISVEVDFLIFLNFRISAQNLL